MKKMNFLMGLLLLTFLGNAFGATGTMTIEHVTDGPSYFNVTIMDNDQFNGVYPGWCADWAVRIEDGTTYNAQFYSSYNNSLPAGLIDHPEHLDEVNWLTNQNAVGEEAPGGLGAFTSGDVQLAIWTLLDDVFDSSTVGPFSQARVDLLVSMSLSEGSDFRPSCKQNVSILIAPSNPEGGRVQTTITEVPVAIFPKCAIPEGEIELK